MFCDYSSMAKTKFLVCKFNPHPSPPFPVQIHTPCQTAAAAAPDTPETPLPRSHSSMPAPDNR